MSKRESDGREGLTKVGETTVNRGVKSTTYRTKTGGEVTYVSRTSKDAERAGKDAGRKDGS